MPNCASSGRCADEAEAGVAATTNPAPANPAVLKKSRLLFRLMVVGFSCLSRGSVGQLLCHHDAGTDDCAGGQAHYSRGQRVRPFALLLQIGRGVAVERRRVVNLDFLRYGKLEEDVGFGAADARVPDRDRPYSYIVEALHGAVGVGGRPLAT